MIIDAKDGRRRLAALLVSISLTTAPVAVAESPRVPRLLTTTATVVKVDTATRHIIVRTRSGENFRLKISPELRNLPGVKPGDRITAVYRSETAYAVTRAGQPPAKDTAAGQVAVAGAVLRIDKARSRLKVVSPGGGEVHDIDVDTPQGRQAMAGLKVGDKVTASVSEALLLAIEPG